MDGLSGHLKTCAVSFSRHWVSGQEDLARRVEASLGMADSLRECISKDISWL